MSEPIRAYPLQWPAGLTLRYRDGPVVLTRAPLPIHRDVPAFLRPQAG